MKHSCTTKLYDNWSDLSLSLGRFSWTRRGDYLAWLLLAVFASAFVVGPFFTLAGGRTFYAVVVSAAIIGVVGVASKSIETNSMRLDWNKRDRYLNGTQNKNGKLEAGEGLFRAAFDHAAGMALVAPDGRWLTVNSALCETLGYAEHELLTTSIQDIVHPDDMGALHAQIRKLLDGGISSQQAEQRFFHKLGHEVWALLNISLIRTSRAEPAYLVFQIQNITDRKRAEARLVHDVFHDALTGLPNRALFMDRLTLALERVKRRKDKLFTVLFLDFDHFKEINDRLGHIIGDQLLIEIARRLKASLRTTDTVARLGGDEFTILLEDCMNESESIRIVERLQKELARPFKLGLEQVPVTVSIGVASSCLGYERAEEILRDADSAMYRAKSAGKARYEVFDQHGHDSSQSPVILKNDLEQAIANQQLLLNYQPMVSLEAGKLLGFEALVRWRHPRRGLISPIEFIPIAENTGAIMEIGLWVLREACTQLRKWHQEFPFNCSLSISVNLSSKQFVQPDLTDQIIDLLRETGLDPSRLKLEITESLVMENIAGATVLLKQLRALGVELGIDDFGTGYSSLSYLHRLPINTLKIDQSFVAKIVENDDNAQIVKTIIRLARSLGMAVVAEGIETLEQLALLRRLRCGVGQGYLFSRPIDVETATALIGIRTEWQATVASLETWQDSEWLDESQPYTNLNALPSRSGLLRAV